MYTNFNDFRSLNHPQSAIQLKKDYLFSETHAQKIRGKNITDHCRLFCFFDRTVKG